MRVILFSLIVLLSCTTAIAEKDPEQIKRRHFYLVKVTASWCSFCHRMDNKVWTDPAIIRISNQFSRFDRRQMVFNIDADKYSKWCKKYKVNSIPMVFVVDSNYRIVRRSKGGYMTVAQLKRFLLKKIPPKNKWERPIR